MEGHAAAADEDAEDPQLDQLIADTPNIPVVVRAALYVHMANVVWCLSVLMLGAVPYYYYQGPQTSSMGLIVCAVLSAVLYALFALAHANRRPITAIVCGCLWTVCMAGLMGFISAMLFNIIALQFVAISFGQSIACIMYLQLAVTKNSNRADGVHIRWQWCVPCMVAATMVVWSLSIYGFMVEGDWWYAGGLLVLAMALCAYNALNLVRASSYGMSEEEITRAICDYYCGDLSAYIKRLQG